MKSRANEKYYESKETLMSVYIINLSPFKYGYCYNLLQQLALHSHEMKHMKLMNQFLFFVCVFLFNPFNLSGNLCES